MGEMKYETCLELWKLQKHLGPWLGEDSAQDILHDIRAFDPESKVTEPDIREFIRSVERLEATAMQDA